MIIRIYATESGSAWSTRTLIWRSDRVDTTVVSDGTETYYPIIYSCSCSTEMGKISTLKFTISPDHPYYSNFKKAKTILTVLVDGTTAGSDGGKCLFRGPVSEISVDVYQQATITAKDALGYLEHSLHVPTGKSDQKKTRIAWLQAAISDHNTQMSSEPEKELELGIVDNFEGSIGEEKSVSDTSYSDNMSFIKSNVQDECAGYLRVRYNSDFSRHFLDFVELRSFGHTATQKLQFAVNIEEVSHDDLTDDIYTVLVPVGKNAKTIEGVGGASTRTTKCQEMDGTWRNVDVTIDGKYMKIQEAIDLYGYIYEPVSFSDKSSKEDIVTEALEHIKSTYHPDNFTLKVKALDFHYLDDEVQFIHLGDKVTVIRHSKRINNELIERKVTAICTAIDYDFSDPENTEYTIGTSFESLTGSSGSSGSSGLGSSGSYGAAINECIGHMDGDRAVIDALIFQVDSEYTYLNSKYISLANRVTITEQQLESVYSYASYTYDWVYHNSASMYAAGQMYEQWQVFQGSQFYQNQYQISSFVGTWAAAYDANGNFIGYKYIGGGGLFIERDNVALGLYDEGSLTGGMIVEKLNDGTVQTTISGDIVNISANTLFRTTVEGLDGRMSDVEQTADSLSVSVTNLEGRISGLRITTNMVDFGFYKASGTGGKDLTAGILVETLSNGSTLTKIKSDYIDFEGMVTADYINSLFLESTRSKFTYLHAENGVDDALWVKNTLYLGSNLGSATNVLSPQTNILDSVISFNDSDHPIEYSGSNVIIPYKKLSGTWGSLTFRNVTSATGSWSDTGGIYTVIAGDTILAVTTISLRQGYTDGSGTWQSGGWTSNPILGYFTYAEVRSGSKTLLSTMVSGISPYNAGWTDSYNKIVQDHAPAQSSETTSVTIQPGERISIYARAMETPSSAYESKEGVRVTVAAANSTDAGFTEGYNKAWATAYGVVSVWPTLGASDIRNMFYVQVPNQTIDTYTQKVIRLLTDATPSANGYATVTVSNYGYATGDAYARVSIGNWYQAGWTDAYNKINLHLGEEQTSSPYYSITVPRSVPGSSDVDTATYGVTADNNYVYLMNVAGGIVLARNTNPGFVNGYNQAWAVAYGVVSVWPPLGESDTRNMFYVQVPNQTKDTYTQKVIRLLPDDTPSANGYVTVTVSDYGYATGTAFARVSIGNWYTAGRNAGWRAAYQSDKWPNHPEGIEGNQFKAYHVTNTVDADVAERIYNIGTEANLITDSGNKYVRIFVYYSSLSNRIATLDRKITLADFNLSSMSITRAQTGASASGVPSFGSGTLYYLDENDGKFHSVASGKYWYYSSTPVTGTTTVYRS